MVDLIKDLYDSNLLGFDRQLCLSNKDLREVLSSVILEHALQISHTKFNFESR